MGPETPKSLLHVVWGLLYFFDTFNMTLLPKDEVTGYQLDKHKWENEKNIIEGIKKFKRPQTMCKRGFGVPGPINFYHTRNRSMKWGQTHFRQKMLSLESGLIW